MIIQIKNVYDKVLYECEALSVKECLELAVRDRANLSGAYLSGADLSAAYLSGADLSRANLSRANLSRADLSGAYLSGADLSRADLFGANLSGADLFGANLSGADLFGANLSGAYLSGAYLSGANLFGADGEKVEIKKQPIQLDTGTYLVMISEDHMKIGCELHTQKDWFNFDDKRIAQMDGKAALSFWAKWNEPLRLICQVHGESK